MRMTQCYTRERQVAIDAVLQACSLARRMQGTLEALDIVNKEDLSPVTITDFSCQALINMHLAKAFPEDEIMGEEDALFLRDPSNKLIKAKVVEQIEHLFPHIQESSILDAIDRGGSPGGPNRRFWVLDPIDGTKGFIRNDQYAVALALIEDGKVVLGVLGCPRLEMKGHTPGGIFSAVKGHGATLLYLDSKKETAVHVRHGKMPDGVIYCEPHKSSSSHNHPAAFKIANFLKAHPEPFQLDSQCKYAVVAKGDAAIYLRIPISNSYREKIWDHAPGKIIVEEAGGQVSDLHGKPFDFSRGKTLSDNFGLLVTNKELHEKALEAVRHVLF